MSRTALPTSNPTILASGRTLDTDTWTTRINNNMLVIGPSGAGKTRHVLKPNLMQMNASFIVLDTKGQLCREMGPLLRAHGYAVQNINFSNMDAACPRCASPVGYDPLAFIRRDPANGRPSQQDILSVATAICPAEDLTQPFWDRAAANLLSCLVAYAVEQLPAAEQTFESVVRLVDSLGDGGTFALLDEVIACDPTSFCASAYLRYRATMGAEKMNASIIGIIAEKVMCLSFDTARALYTHSPQVDFARMGHEPTALFVTLSDMDRSLDPLTNLFLTQALISLGREADAMPSGSLPVPVRMFLDDFGNFHIPNFEQAISVVRSKNIWCAMLCQTTSQLAARYGEEGANTIIGNCDTQLVLAFQDTASARYFSDRANKPVSALLATPLDRSWLFCAASPVSSSAATRWPTIPCTTRPSRLSTARTHWKSTPRRSTTRRVRPCKTLQLSSDRPEPATAPKFTWGRPCPISRTTSPTSALPRTRRASPTAREERPLHGRSIGSIATRRLTDRPVSHPRKT